MSELAADLRVWARSLGWIADELIEPLAQAAGELRAMLGPLRPRGTRRGGEPDGFKGLTRRGPYDRLLLSEWAMLDEVPDEFLRRAIASEHAFYDLDHREPARSLSVRVVLDAGPTQLGVPRLGQLSALLLLVRRAQLAQATIRWSVAQSPGLVWDTLDRASIRGVLAARSLAPFELPDLSAEPTPDELWLVGPPPSAAWGSARVLTLSERLTPEDDLLEATTIDARGVRHTRTLTLPPPTVRRRLITDPFAVAPAASPPRDRRSLAPTGDEVGWTVWSRSFGAPTGARFVRNTQKLELLHERGVQLVNLSKLPKASHAKSYPTDPNTLIATGYHEGRPVLIERSKVSDGLNVSGYRMPTPTRGVADRGQRGVAPEVGPGEFFALDGEGWIVDATGRLFKIPHSGPLDAAFAGVTVLDALVGRGHVRLILRVLRNLHVVTPVAGDELSALVTGEATPRLVLGPADKAFFSLPDPTHAFAVLRSGAQWTVTPIPLDRLPMPEPLPGDELSFELDPLTTVLGVRRGDHGLLLPVLWEIDTVKVLLHEAETLNLPRVPISPKLSLDGRYLAFHTAPNDTNLPGGTFELWDLERRAPCLLRKQEAPWKG